MALSFVESKVFSCDLACRPTLMRRFTQVAYLEELLQQYTLVQACLKHSDKVAAGKAFSCCSLKRPVLALPPLYTAVTEQTSATPNAVLSRRSVARCTQHTEDTAILQ